MAHYTLIARINAGNGKFPFVNVQFSRNHRPIPIEEATYYLRPSNSGKRTPIRIGKDLALAHTALVRLEGGQSFELPAAVQPDPKATVPSNVLRKTIQDTAHEYIERSRQKSRRTYLGYRTAVNLFVASCKKTYFDEICRDDMLDFLHQLRIRPSLETGAPIGESTVFNYFLKVMVFLNDRGIGKYIAREDWVQKKDWPVNVDKRNKNKKYATLYGSGYGRPPSDCKPYRRNADTFSRRDRLSKKLSAISCKLEVRFLSKFNRFNMGR